MIDYYEVNYDLMCSFYPLSRKVYDKLFAIAELKEIKAGTKLVSIGEVSRKLFLINKGVLRSYLMMENGKEITKTLFTPIEFFASFTSMLTNTPSEFTYETLTDCHIYEINYEAFVELCNTNTEVLKFYSRYLEFLFIEGESAFIAISSMNAKQRYLKLKERIPNIENLIPQYQIASYLNITPVQLSRIRSKLY
ncbi:Crp/Fnr family transcriptional regulator [Psychroserpens algicola]|uniref:Crp/Fnr family transcriptional regulator n=1 Tax=Psychroserpens algicola TaxID=1719034 RepID=A0ABT0HA30_9FLAO|nr:Crp/Fnr family transcriptional regulator [Psychroserpens algicola]MCK8481220.1 Crp/Fnr family transcriptional regulator [Psychroserpens algicola]